MKKYISLGIVSLLMLISGCNRDEWNNIKGKAETDKIEFAVKLHVDTLDMDEEPWATTRGTPLPDYKAMSSMGMFCFVTDNSFATDGPTAKPNKMDNVRLNRKLEGETLSWDYDPSGDEVTWKGITPAQCVTFFGYAPYGGVGDNGISIITDYKNAGVGAPVLRYNVPTDVDKQPDLLVAKPRIDIKSTGDAVQLVYKHMLTTVGFEISGNGEKISKIIIKGISTQADLSLDIPLSGDPVWNNLETLTTGLYQASIKTDPGQTYYTATATPTNVIKDNGYLMMIPQTLTEDATAIVEMSDGTQKGYSLSVKEWKPGKKIVYSINVSPTSLVIAPANWFNALGKGDFIQIKVSGAIWKATIEGSNALVMSKTEGFDGDEVTLTWPQNIGDPTPDKRFASIKFKAVTNGYGQIDFHSSQLGRVQDYIPYNGVKWARGPLISDGDDGCKIGDPTDGGLLFQYCSLIGYRGGSDGSGVGLVNPTWESKYWGGETTKPASLVDDIVARPDAILPENGGIGLPTAWFAGTMTPSLDFKYFFGLGSAPYNNTSSWWQSYLVSPHGSYSGFLDGVLYSKGVGDPCLYYLGKGWSMPTVDQYWSLLNRVARPNPDRFWTLDEVGGEYNASPKGVYFASKSILFTPGGTRNGGDGRIFHVDDLLPGGGSPFFTIPAIEIWSTTNHWAFAYQYEFDPILLHRVSISQSPRNQASPVRCVYNM